MSREAPDARTGLFRMALRAFPVDFRAAHGPEMLDAFRRERSRRLRSAGRLAAHRYVLRAVWDALRAGWTERTRSGVPAGHGRPPQGEPNGGGGVMRGWTMDVRVALRALAKNPGFTVAAVLVLALGIGANTTVFSALRAAVLAPAPFAESDRLVFADLVDNEPTGEARISPWSYPKYRVLVEAGDRLIEPLAGYARRIVTVTGPDTPERMSVEFVGTHYFRVLGVEPVLGRGFAPDEASTEPPPLVAVLSHGFWRGGFGGGGDVLGREMIVNGDRVIVVGVAPEGFDGLSGDIDFWMPLASSGAVVSPVMMRASQAHWMRVVGRLRPGATFEDARDQMKVIGDGVQQTYPIDGESVYSGTARRFDDVRVNEGARAAVMVLSAAAMLVLLVACANLSGLLLTRVRRRARDGAVRMAMGALRWQLARASLIESGILALLGGALGLLLSVWGTAAMAEAWPSQFLRSADSELTAVSTDALGVDLSVLTFGALATLATIVLFGIAPALRGSGVDLADRLKDGGATSRRSQRLFGFDGRSVLVGAQVAMALVLLVGAALMGGSMQRLLDVDPGFRADNLLTFRYEIPRESAWQNDLMGFHRALIERIEALPGVESANLGIQPHTGHWSITGVQEIEGQPRFAEGERIMIGLNIVSPGHFESLGIPLLRGRTFDSRDGDDPLPTVVINRTAAAEMFGDDDPIGRRVELGISDEGKERFAEVVGVVGDVLYGPPDEGVMPEAYYAMAEFPLIGSQVAVRTEGEPTAIVPAVRSVLSSLEPTMPMSSVRTMDSIVSGTTGDRRVILALLTIFSVVTLLLAATGTWGIVSYAVAARRRELGLRIALGAGRSRVLSTVLRQSLVAGGVGLVLGLAGAWAGGRLLDAFLYRTSARDPMAFAVGSALLMTVVFLASYLPARRATRVDPVEALKAE